MKGSTSFKWGFVFTIFLLWLMQATFDVFKLFRSFAEQTGLPLLLQIGIVVLGVWFFVSYVLRILPGD